MSFDPGNPPDGPRRRPPSGAQGASRGGFQPDDSPDDGDRQPSDRDPRGGWSGGQQQPSYGGGQYTGGWGGGQRSSTGWGSYFDGSKKFLGLPVGLIYAFGTALLGIVLFSAVCGKPPTGSLAGQVKALNADRTVTTVAGAQVVLVGGGQTLSATTKDVPANADGEAAYNYRFENVPRGEYTMTVTPPSGSNLQPEDPVKIKVESGQLFPQSVLLLAQGIQKPRPLAANELQPGEQAGYVNDRGERVVYRQGSSFDATDALLLYLLWRNPSGWGYGYPPVIVNSPGGSSGGSSYRVSDPPSRTQSGQTVTQQKPSTPGQGSTRPSSSTGATGPAPSYSSGPSGSSGSSTAPSSSSSGSSSSSSGGSSTTTRPSISVPSQGATRPSSSSSSSSRPSSSSSSSSRSSGSSGGGRR